VYGKGGDESYRMEDNRNRALGISTVDKALCVNTIELPVTGVQYGKKGGE
jgi:hypothetical protein